MAGTYFFAGGGTGGHIYPAIAVAQHIREIEPQAEIRFFCSGREVDSKILSQAELDFTVLPARSFSVNPAGLTGFFRGFLKSRAIAAEAIARADKAVVVGVGGFVAAPVCWAGRKAGAKVALLNVDFVPGRANKLLCRWADEIFVQFDETAEYFAKGRSRVNVFGCPLREEFDRPQAERLKEKLGLDKNKKILLITGASSGAANVSEAVCMLLDKLAGFAQSWQIVHLTGRGKIEQVKIKYAGAKIAHTILDYCDDMPSLLAGADLIVGRSGAVSVAEYAASGTASICMPYPYHKDRHQYLNAGKLVEAGAGVIVDDLADAAERAGWLWEEMEALMRNDAKRRQMAGNCASIVKKDAALMIAQRLVQMAG